MGAGLLLPFPLPVHGQQPLAVESPSRATAEIVEIVIEDAGLQITSSRPIQGISAITDEDGRPQILLPDHRLPEARQPAAGPEWLNSLELRSERGEEVDFVRLSVFPTRPLRYRLRTDGAVARFQVADPSGAWIDFREPPPSPAGDGEVEPALDPADEDEAERAEPAPAAEIAPALDDSNEPSPAALEPGIWRVVEGVNLRAGPGVAQRKIGSVGPGQLVTVQEVRGGWARVEVGDRRGWLFGRYLEPAVIPSPPER